MEEPQFPWWVLGFVLLFGSCFAAVRWGFRKYLLDADTRQFPLPLWLDALLAVIIIVLLLALNLL